MDSAHKQQVLNRLKTIEGHVRGVQRMVEADTYCVDLLKQTRAIQQALSKLDQLILEEHLQKLRHHRDPERGCRRARARCT